VVEQLAKALGGEVAATRVWSTRAGLVLDAGGADRQDGVAKLYVACGISGAIQHKVDGQRRVIVAINKDVNAPIFEFADLGVVGDVLTVMPKDGGAGRAGGSLRSSRSCASVRPWPNGGSLWSPTRPWPDASCS
jgi:hypothetical protein